MNEQRFACTACGLCCNGLLPLTITEALGRADRFPLAITITPIKAALRGHTAIGRIGVSVNIGKGKPLDLLVTPVSFIPPSHTCPALSPQGLCSIHAEKPLRCKAMPFYAYKDEDSQRELLVPKPGWQCDTSEQAPVVYRDRKIVEKADFSDERTALVQQVPVLQHYVQSLLKYDPSFPLRLQKGLLLQAGGKLINNFVSLLRFDKTRDLAAFARSQHPVLNDWIHRTETDPKLVQFTNYYREASADLSRYLA